MWALLRSVSLQPGGQSADGIPVRHCPTESLRCWLWPDFSSCGLASALIPSWRAARVELLLATIRAMARRSSARAMAGKAPRHPWHLWQSRHCGFCKLQNRKEPPEFESHSLRQLLFFRFNNLQAHQQFPVQRSMGTGFTALKIAAPTAKRADLLP
jgi:hypothetical protein